jgi:hypothetical protein
MGKQPFEGMMRDAEAMPTPEAKPSNVDAMLAKMKGAFKKKEDELPEAEQGAE